MRDRQGGQSARGLHRLRIWADIATVGLFIVIWIGFLDTLTGSAEGCGAMWPLCNGGFVPSPTLQSEVEYTHRAVTGLVGVLVAVVVIWAWKRWARGEVRLMGFIALWFVVVQAVLGAAAVLWPESPPIMALHFGFALLAFGGLALMTALLHQIEGERNGRTTGWRLRATPVPPNLARFTWAILLFTLGIAYWGTYVAHVGAGTACSGWPLCNGQWIPGFSGKVGIMFIHRLAALVEGALLLRLFFAARAVKTTRPDVYRAAHLGLALVALQILSGAYLVLSHLSTAADLIHVSIVTVLFTVIAYMALQMTPRRDQRELVRPGVQDA